MLKIMKNRYNTAYPSHHVQQHALSDSGHEDYIPVYKVSLCTLRGKATGNRCESVVLPKYHKVSFSSNSKILIHSQGKYWCVF